MAGSCKARSFVPFRHLSLTGRKYYKLAISVGRKPFHGYQALGLDHFDGDEAVDADIVAGGAEEVGFRLVDDGFAYGVLVDMGDLVHEETGLVILDAQRAAAILPEGILIQPPEGFAIFFEAVEHPFPAKVHFHFDGLQQCRGRIFLKIPFKIGRGSGVPCAQHEMKVAAHKAPGIKVQALRADKMVQGIDDHLFVSGPYEQVNLIYYIECQKIAGVKRYQRLVIRQHTQLV